MPTITEINPSPTRFPTQHQIRPSILIKIPNSKPPSIQNEGEIGDLLTGDRICLNDTGLQCSP